MGAATPVTGIEVLSTVGGFGGYAVSDDARASGRERERSATGG